MYEFLFLELIYFLKSNGIKFFKKRIYDILIITFLIQNLEQII